jgi:hypothetical protein
MPADTAGEMAERRTATRAPRAAQGERRELGPNAFKAPLTTTARRRRNDLHVCPVCDSELVYPIDWAPAPGGRWTVDLRCPDCEWRGGGTYDQRVVDRFDDALDRGTESLLEDLGLIVRANMEEQLDRFVTALHSAAILPEDF